jgi:hypothetical protein
LPLYKETIRRGADFVNTISSERQIPFRAAVAIPLFVTIGPVRDLIARLRWCDLRSERPRADREELELNYIKHYAVCSSG